ncbi:hypothetical protein [Vibrio sp. Y58_MX_L22]|uniref:hypothetical protein n=1 Tax=Vibrio sp. Y58_MX_L22 TaxID=2957763 RepID=UPI0020A6111B|nr:hypothetical protein [Vibrio sp. Y58_MX_L22]ELI1598875.1 hypothetical protein [Vibrio alginolyticus]
MNNNALWNLTADSAAQEESVVRKRKGKTARFSRHVIRRRNFKVNEYEANEIAPSNRVLIVTKS